MMRIIVTLLIAFAVLPAAAQTLRIGMKAAVDGSDPHQSYSPNRNVQMHVYESLTFQNETLHPGPWLAESWRVVEPTVWEFRLRQGAMFHDGTPLSAGDVVFSILRAQAATGLRTYASLMRGIVGAEVVDQHTVRIRTAATYGIHVARKVAETVWNEAGATAIFDSNPFERRYRDIHTVTQQAQGRSSHFENVGNWMLGGNVNLRFV